MSNHRAKIIGGPSKSELLEAIESCIPVSFTVSSAREDSPYMGPVGFSCQIMDIRQDGDDKYKITISVTDESVEFILSKEYFSFIGRANAFDGAIIKIKNSIRWLALQQTDLYIYYDPNERKGHIVD